RSNVPLVYVPGCCLYVPSYRLRTHVSSRSSELRHSQQTARPYSAPLFHTTQQHVSLAHQHVGDGASCGHASYQKPTVFVEDRDVLHTVNCEVNPAIKDCLIDFFFEDSFLVEREEGCSLVHITRGSDD